jgi:hypothetical protein
MKQSLTVSESYWGYAAIAARMGWRSIKPLYRHIKQHSFPAYKRIDPRNRFRVMWFTHEGLILRWELILAQDERERLLARQDQNRVIVTRSRGEKRKQRFV